VIATYHIPGSQALSLTGSGGPLSAHIRQSGFAISGISWSPDGKAIVSCFSEGLIQVWNPQTGQPTETLHPQNGEGCTGVAWSPDGKYIAASMLGQILVWNAQTQQIIFQSTAPQAELFAGVSWQPGTDDLAASLEGTAISLEITPTPTPTSSTFNPTPTPTLPPTPTPTPAPGSTDHRSEMPSAGSTPTPTPTPVLTSGPDMLKIWSIPDGHLLKAITGISGNVTWSPDGKKIAYASQFAYGSPMTVAILDIASGQTTYTYHAPSAQIELGGLAWSPDGRYIAVIMTTPAAATATPSGAYSESLVAQIWMA
jgi:WD40 repeat protein